MKLKLITLIVSLSTLCIFSCKDRKPTPEEGTNVMILRMNLPGTKTRSSIEAPITSTVVPGLQKVDIYLYDKESGLVYSVLNLNARELEEAASDDGLQLRNLHANIDAIAIICNDTEDKNLRITVNENISILFEKPLNINLEQDFNNVTYIGKDEDLVQINTPVGGNDDLDYFNGSVVISPLVVRVEVAGITCTDFGEEWASLYLRSVYVDNIYESGINLDYLENPPINPVTIIATAAQAEGSTQYWWLEALEAPNLGPSASINQTPWNPAYGVPTVTGAFAFHIFENGSVPNLGLQIDATASGSTNQGIDMYVTFNKYADATGPINPFKVGHIYKIIPRFLEDKVVTYSSDPGEIILSITVHEWTIHDNIIAGT